MAAILLLLGVIRIRDTFSLFLYRVFVCPFYRTLLETMLKRPELSRVGSVAVVSSITGKQWGAQLVNRQSLLSLLFNPKLPLIYLHSDGLFVCQCPNNEFYVYLGRYLSNTYILSFDPIILSPTKMRTLMVSYTSFT